MKKEEQKRARKAKAQQKKLLTWGGWLIVIGLIVWGIVALSNQSAPSGVSIGSVDGVEIFEDDHLYGPEDASVVVVEYGDFQCPACARYATTVNELKKSYGDRVAFIFKHFPLSSIHPNARVSSQAAVAAANQGKFWEMHDLLFSKQNEWATQSNPFPFFSQYAEQLGLDLNQFSEDFNSSETKSKINRDLSEANGLNLRGTPSFLVNGVYIETPGSYSAFATLLDEALATTPTVPTEPVAVHEHAFIAVDIEGNERTLLPVYLDEKPALYMDEDMTNVIHKTMTGARIEDLFASFGGSLSQGCLSLSNELGEVEEYCNTNSKGLLFFLNGELMERIHQYEPQDGDRIFIYYGDPEQAMQKSAEYTEIFANIILDDHSHE